MFSDHQSTALGPPDWQNGPFGLLDMNGKSRWNPEYVTWPRSCLSPPTCKLNWERPRRLRCLIPSSPLCLPQIQTFTASSCPFILSEDCKNESEIIPLKGCWLGCGVCNLQLTDRLWNLIWVKVLICILFPDWGGGGRSVGGGSVSLSDLCSAAMVDKKKKIKQRCPVLPQCSPCDSSCSRS